jgi:flagellar biosynthesis/type III secretory pathway protein FliH
MPPLRLEVFETGQPSKTTAVVTDLGAIEEEKLSAYEQGYTAGWDDSSAAQAEEQAQLSAEIARNLQALTFTFHEARTHVLRSIEPLLADMVTRLLPEVARAALAPVVRETLQPLAEDLAGSPVEIVLNPVARPAVEAILEENAGLPVTLIEEPSLSEGQLYIRLGQAETHVDLDAAVAAIATAVQDFFTLSGKDNSNG